jgi:hypothetical protein
LIAVVMRTIRQTRHPGRLGLLMGLAVLASVIALYLRADLILLTVLTISIGAWAGWMI